MFAKSKRTLALLAIGLLLLIGSSVGAQEARLTSNSLDDHLISKLQVSLQRLIAEYNGSGTYSRVAPSFELTRQFERLQNGGTRPSLRIFDNKVQIVVETHQNSNLNSIMSWIDAHSGSVEVEARGSIQALVPVPHLEALSQLSDVSFVRLPIRMAPRQQSTAAAAQGNRVTEGVNVLGSDIWNNAGLDGEGVDVGIIDQFGRYRELMGRELPNSENVTIRSFASHGEIFDPDVPEEFQSHGTSVAEIIYDIAPGASHHIAYFDTLVEFVEAADWMMDEGVDVVNTSLGFDSGCFQEGDGLFEPVFDDAHDSGITWASASGNEADIHYLDMYSDPDNDTRHNFSGDDEGNSVETLLTELELSDGSVVATAEFFVIYSWDASCTNATDDYEMVLMREVNGFLEVVPEDNMFSDWYFEPGRPIKFFFGFYDYDPSRVGERETFHLGFRKINPIAEDTRIMALHYGCLCFSIEYLNIAGSVGILEPGVSPHVIGVGAAHHSATACPQNPSAGFFCPDGRLLFYSSQGPSKDGRQKPELTAPTHVSTVTSGSYTGDGFNDNPGFTGTSASTPHVSGAAALAIQALREQDMGTSPEEVLSFLQSRAEDLGEPGIDNAYGAGIVNLGQPPIDLQANAPVIHGINPASGLQGANLTATISGDNLDRVSDVAISGAGVSAEIVSETFSTLSLMIEISADADPGQRSVVLTTSTESVQNDDVVFTVVRGPTLEVNPEGINFSATTGEENPEARDLTINNIGGGGFNWTASADVSWITIDPAMGTLDDDTSAQTATVSVDIAGLEAGVHEGSITVDSPDALNGPITIPVTLSLEQGEEPPPIEDGSLLALKFIELEFANASDWTRNVMGGCVIYTNISENASPLNVTLPDGTVNEFSIAAGNKVIVCVDVVHIDTSAADVGESEPEPEEDDSE